LNITKNNGFEFVDFIVVSEEEIYKFKPVVGSYAVINCSGKYLICYNSSRKQWEIPAGKREENETPKDCAIRELFEETGQVVSDFEFLGLLKVKNITNDKVKYNPIYFSTIEALQQFRKNNETTKIKLWDLKETVGYIDEVDIKIFDYFK
jgi:8-oxo-dGTP diphosphatase